MISAIAVRNYLSVLAERGIESDQVLARSRLDPNQLGDQQYMIEFDQYRTIVDNIIRLTGDEGIGLELGTHIDLTNLGVIGHTALTCKTVRETQQLWIRFGTSLVGIMGRLDIVSEDESSVLLAMSSPDPRDSLFQFSVEEMLGLLCMIGKPLVGHSSGVLGVAVSYPTPAHAEKYQQLFSCPISFSATRTTVRVTRAWFDEPVQTHDKEFNSICWRHCESLLERFGEASPTSVALRRVFDKYTDSPLPSLEEAGQGLAARTSYLASPASGRRHEFSRAD